jgi:archaellum biogenesis ATPase FlaH
MIRVLFGEKGTGKTKLLVNAANDISSESKGDVVFIDDSNQLMYDLNHKIRFINVAEYPIKGQAGFLGFISGIVSQNYDIDTLIIDGLTYITRQKPEDMKEFFDGIKILSDSKNVNFIITVTGSSAGVPDFIREYRVDAL